MEHEILSQASSTGMGYAPAVCCILSGSHAVGALPKSCGGKGPSDHHYDQIWSDCFGQWYAFGGNVFCFFSWGFEPLNARCFGRFFYLVAYSGTWCWMCVWWFRQMKHFQPDFFFPGVCSGMSTSKPRRSTFSLISWNSSLPSQIGNISVLYMLWTGLRITSRITDSIL